MRSSTIAMIIITFGLVFNALAGMGWLPYQFSTTDLFTINESKLQSITNVPNPTDIDQEEYTIDLNVLDILGKSLVAVLWSYSYLVMFGVPALLAGAIQTLLYTKYMYDIFGYIRRHDI